MKTSDVVKAVVVDVIRGLWGRGLYRRNEIAKRVHENWFEHWVEWKTANTMRDVDEQIEELRAEWSDDDALTGWSFTEETEGETPLGGEMRLRAPWEGQEGP